MDFDFTEEQRLLRDSLSAFLADSYGFDARRTALRSDTGWRPEIWRAMAQDLGLFGAAIPEAQGGMGGGPVDTLVIMEEFGRALVVEPYLETVVIAGGLLKRIDSPRAQDALARLIAGDLVAALAWGEPASRYDMCDITTRARPDGAGWRLNGRKAVVSAAPWATELLVTARIGGGQRDRAGIGLFLVDKTAAGITTRDYPTVDGRRAAEIDFDDVVLGADALLIEDEPAVALLEQVFDEARAALCAEGLGVMDELLRQTVEYAKQRRQFGQPIGAFQVLQHRMVDMYIQQEQSVSITYRATLKLDLPGRERAKAVAAAKFYVGRACTQLGQAAVQIHGGMGLTDELPLSHYFKRATMIESAFGSSDHHIRRYQAL